MTPDELISQARSARLPGYKPYPLEAVLEQMRLMLDLLLGEIDYEGGKRAVPAVVARMLAATIANAEDLCRARNLQ